MKKVLRSKDVHVRLLGAPTSIDCLDQSHNNHSTVSHLHITVPSSVQVQNFFLTSFTRVPALSQDKSEKSDDIDCLPDQGNIFFICNKKQKLFLDNFTAPSQSRIH